MTPDGSGLAPLTSFASGASRAGHPSWTPDGTRVIFTKIDGTDFGGMGTRRIAFIDADGANFTIVSEEHLGTYPRLQPTP